MVLPKKGGPFTLGTHPRPKPGKGELLVRIVATALNPVDHKIGKLGIFLGKDSYPAVIGCDVSGVVEEAGPGCSFKKGDEVMSFLRIGAPGFGSFGEYTLAVENVTIRKPKNLTHVEAAAVPLGLITAAAALYNDLGLPMPSDKSSPRPKSVLIWGASGSIGSFGVQLAKLSGIQNVIAVCGPKNVDYVKSLGATHVFSHADGIPKVVEQIKQVTGGDLHHAYDCISPATAAACVSA